MPNGYHPNPHHIEFKISGGGNQPASWRTAALPPSHSVNGGYWITEADKARILEILAQQLDPLIANAPQAAPDPPKPPSPESPATASGASGRSAPEPSPGKPSSSAGKTS